MKEHFYKYEVLFVVLKCCDSGYIQQGLNSDGDTYLNYTCSVCGKEVKLDSKYPFKVKTELQQLEKDDEYVKNMFIKAGWKPPTEDISFK